MFVMREVDKIRKALPALKLCRGDSFDVEHWSALLKLLDLQGDNKINWKTLSTSHLLAQAQILAGMKFCGVLFGSYRTFV